MPLIQETPHVRRHQLVVFQQTAHVQVIVAGHVRPVRRDERRWRWCGGGADRGRMLEKQDREAADGDGKNVCENRHRCRVRRVVEKTRKKERGKKKKRKEKKWRVENVSTCSEETSKKRDSRRFR